MPVTPAKAASVSPAFDEAMKLILHDEGGFAVRPTEGGGSVNMGITYTVFAAWRKKHGQPEPTLPEHKAMTVAEAEAIYKAQFADPIRFDELPRGVGYVLLDSAVNNGVGGMLRILQRALGTRQSPHVEDGALAAIAQRGPDGTINAFCDERKRQQALFKNATKPIRPGSKRLWKTVWDERVERVRKAALAMVDA